MFIGLEVMWHQSRHLIENLTEIVPHFFSDAYLLLKQVKGTHHQILVTIERSRFPRVFLCQVWNDGLMNLHSNLLFNLSANRFDDLVTECLEDLFLIVLYCNIWFSEMLDVPKHIQWVIKCHEEIVELVWSFRISQNHFKDIREQ